jgi:endonuclease/exonuclease/phosphatase (EEP) superfamily protein YafD
MAAPGNPADDELAPPPRAGIRGRHLWAAAALSVCAAVALFPDIVFEIDRFTPFAQLVSLRPFTAAGLAVLGMVFGVAALRYRPCWPFAAGLLVVAVAGAATVLPRAIAAPTPATGSRSLTVMAFNAFNGGADVGAVAALIRVERPDIVSLVEAGGRYRARLAPLVEPLGYRLYPSTSRRGGEEVSGVTAVVAAGLGDVRAEVVGRGMPFPSVQVTGGNLGDLRFLAFHSVAPRRGDVPQWRSDLARLPAWCAGSSPAIVAGDFNATLDNSTFRTATAGCTDAAAQRGDGLVPTWPTWLPDWIGPQIDHVLVTPAIAAETFEVREIPGSDHRAVITRLALPAATTSSSS